jgi:hypothetical protein
MKDAVRDLGLKGLFKGTVRTIHAMRGGLKEGDICVQKESGVSERIGEERGGGIVWFLLFAWAGVELVGAHQTAAF